MKLNLIGTLLIFMLVSCDDAYKKKYSCPTKQTNSFSDTISKFETIDSEKEKIPCDIEFRSYYDPTYKMDLYWDLEFEKKIIKEKKYITLDIHSDTSKSIIRTVSFNENGFPTKDVVYGTYYADKKAMIYEYNYNGKFIKSRTYYWSNLKPNETIQEWETRTSTYRTIDGKTLNIDQTSYNAGSFHYEYIYENDALTSIKSHTKNNDGTLNQSWIESIKYTKKGWDRNMTMDSKVIFEENSRISQNCDSLIRNVTEYSGKKVLEYKESILFEGSAVTRIIVSPGYYGEANKPWFSDKEFIYDTNGLLKKNVLRNTKGKTIETLKYRYRKSL